MTPASLINTYHVAAIEEQLSHLIAFLAARAADKIIVYMLTCACVDYFGAVFSVRLVLVFCCWLVGWLVGWLLLLLLGCVRRRIPHSPARTTNGWMAQCRRCQRCAISRSRRCTAR